jgi:hypothetical protein
MDNRLFVLTVVKWSDIVPERLVLREQEFGVQSERSCTQIVRKQDSLSDNEFFLRSETKRKSGQRSTSL